MNTHDDEFWGDQAEWTSTTEHARLDLDRTRPLDAIRRGWRQMMSSGATPTREHGIVHPRVIHETDHFDDFDLIGGDHTVISSGIDVTDATPVNAIDPHLFDDLDDDLGRHDFGHDNVRNVARDLGDGYGGVDSGEGVAVTWGDGFVEVERRHGLDPLLSRLGAIAVIVTLLVPLLLGARSGDDATLVATASSIAAAQLDPATTVAADDAPSPASTPAIAVDTSTTDAGVGSDDRTVGTAAATASSSVVADTADVPATDVATSDVPTVDVGEALQTTSEPTGAAATAAAANTPADRVPRVCAIDYEVVAGDFWIRLADGAGVPLAELLEANGASSSTPLYPGESICLPAGSTIPSPPPTAPATTTPAATPATTPPTTEPAPTTTTTTTTTSTTTTVPSAPADVEQVIRDVWPDDLEERALEIAWRESNYQPRAKNFCCYGLFQIYWSVHQGWLDEIGVTTAQHLYDPTTNAEAAYALYQRAGGWGPWGF